MLARGKDLTDGAIPSGNSVAAHNLVFLAGAARQPDYLPLASKTIAATVVATQSNPAAAPLMLTAIPALLEAKSKLKQ